jgi:methionine aminopeptidase
MSSLLGWASRVNQLPLLQMISPSAARVYTANECESYLKAQSLAQQCAKEIESYLQPGWTEAKASSLMESWLRDHGVKTFFHKPFVWWGDRTRFTGVKNYWDYLPSQRVLCEGDVYILDVAPIVDGAICDIGYSGFIGGDEIQTANYHKAIGFLEALRRDLPAMATGVLQGRELWRDIDQKMTDAGYQNIHKTYPFGVLGHRLHKNSVKSEASFIHFGWQSYWELLSRGLFGQLLNKDFQGKLDGLWAIEPHIGTELFGVKFEEILVIENGAARWLNPVGCFHSN